MNTFTVSDYPRPGVSVAVSYSYDRGLPIATTVTVTSEREPVSTELLREVAVRTLLKENVPRMPSSSIPDGIDVESMRRQYAETSPKSPFTELTEAIRAGVIQEVYKKAQKQNLPPVKAVMEVFELPRRTAGRRIRESRERLGWE